MEPITKRSRGRPPKRKANKEEDPIKLKCLKKVKTNQTKPSLLLLSSII